MSPPPARTRLPDFAGRALSLADGPAAWERLDAGPAGRDVLLLGLGPGDPRALPFVHAAQHAGGAIFWLEEPETLRRLHPQGFVDPGWRRLTPEEAGRLSGAAVYL
ncbi:MAG: hypothetical protein K2G99_03540, partial [Desulfovibrio sp.]|nr:hypothetical protein [Desulfovibrio sp.]